MNAVLKVVAVLCIALAAFFLYAIIAAVTSDEGARAGVCVIYAAIAGVLGFLSMKLWAGRSQTA